MQIPQPGAMYVHQRTEGHYRIVGCAKCKMGGKWVEDWVVYAALENGIGVPEGKLYVRKREDFLRHFEEVRAGGRKRPEAAKGPKGREFAAPAGRGDSEGKTQGEGGQEGQETIGMDLGVEGPEGLEPLTAVRARELAQRAREDGEMRRVLGVVLGAVEGAARRGERELRLAWGTARLAPGFATGTQTFVREELGRLGFAVEALDGEPDLGLRVGW